MSGEGGYWCTAKCAEDMENRGKGGSGKGKIGAGVGCLADLWIQIRYARSGPSRAPIFAFLGTAFGHVEDPVDSTKCREAAKCHKK